MYGYVFGYFLWLQGPLPSRRKIFEFAKHLSRELKRVSFAYAIKDKRTRDVSIRTPGNAKKVIGAVEKNWLLGVVSPNGETFSQRENATIRRNVTEFFSTTVGPPPGLSYDGSFPLFEE